MLEQSLSMLGTEENNGVDVEPTMERRERTGEMTKIDIHSW